MKKGSHPISGMCVAVATDCLPGRCVDSWPGALQALNDLFEKLLQRDVPSRYLLRLGMGEAELATEDDFSRAGRVNTMLARRIELLAEVSWTKRLQSPFQRPDVSSQEHSNLSQRQCRIEMARI